jgi:hypothetical protein
LCGDRSIVRCALVVSGNRGAYLRFLVCRERDAVSKVRSRSGVVVGSIMQPVVRR